MYYKLKERVKLINESIPADSVYDEEWKYVYDIRTWKRIYDNKIDDIIQYFILHDKSKLEVSDNMEFKSKPKTVFDLKYSDEIWYIDTDWDIRSTRFQEDCQIYSEIFISKEEAEKELEKRKAIFNIKKYCYDNNIEIRNDFIIWKDNYYIVYDWDVSNYNCKYIYMLTKEFNTLNIILFFNYEIDYDNVLDNCKEDLNILFNIK